MLRYKLKDKKPNKIRLYHPHSEIGGPIIPLPKPMRKLAKSLEGRVMTLAQAFDIINPIAKTYKNGVIEDWGSYISFSFITKNNICNLKHNYRLIRYKEAKEWKNKSHKLRK